MTARTTRTVLAPVMETPPELFDALWEDSGGFDLDPCCTPEQYTAQRVLDNSGTIYVPPDEHLNSTIRAHHDGLAQSWHGKVWMNPPYDKTLPQWIEKAVSEVEKGNAQLVRALLPVQSNRDWWQRYVCQTLTSRYGGLLDLRFLPKRQRFWMEGKPMPYQARFASAVVVWGMK